MIFRIMRRVKHRSKSLYALCALLCFLSFAGVSFAQKKGGGIIAHDSAPQRGFTQKDLKTDSQKLWENLTKNVIQLPFGTELEITGVIVSKGISRYMTANVMLSDKKGGDPYVICVLPGRGDILNLADFNVGEEITMRGKFYATRSQIVVKQCVRVEEAKKGE